MAKKSSTPTFVLELPLVVTKANERIILSRLEAGRRLYNTTLHEALKRLSAMRSSLEWQSVRELPKGKERNEAFKAVNEHFGFSEYALHDFVKPVRLKAGWKDRLSAQEAQKIASRVFKAVSEYAFGARGKPRFKCINRPLHSLEGKQNTVVQPWVAVKRLQRKLDRSRRAINPTNYNANGTIKKGVKLVWKQSSRYQQNRTTLATTERKLTAARKRDHGELVNKILAQGNVIKTETVSHKGFQKNFGRSAKVRASGLFFSLLTRKADSAGGQVIELNTRALAMSQYDHVSDSRAKKPLSQRHHNLADGKSCVQRDMYSAFLALNASGKTHNPHQLQQSWSAVEPLLRRTGLCVDQSANGKASRFPTVLLPSERIVRQSILGTGQGVRFSRN
jgi:hypothetical protein